MEATRDKQPLPCPDHREYDLKLPSSLTQFGIDAMRWWEALEGAQIRMTNYRVQLRLGDFKEGDSTYQTVCFACCGGAARCAVEGWTPENFKVSVGEENFQRTDSLEHALDWLRGGCVVEAFYGTGYDPRELQKFNRYISPYHQGAEDFYRDMRQLADDLKAGGY